MELYPFYSQCFLMVGLAVERWVYICRPHSSKEILRRGNKLIIYAMIIALSLIIPSFVLADYIFYYKVFSKKQGENWSQATTSVVAIMFSQDSLISGSLKHSISNTR